MPYVITDKCNGCIACVKFCPTGAISGERKKLHTIDASKCIECGVCGRICPDEVILNEKGQTAKKMKRAEWPKPVFGDGCLGCSICIDDCPFGCMDLSESKENGPRPAFKFEKACVGCGVCADDCPVNVIVMKSP